MNFHVQLAEVEELIVDLAKKGHHSDSPQMQALHRKRSRLAAKVTPDIKKMTISELEAERAALLPVIKKAKRNPVLCNATMSMMRRRNLALKDAIEARKQGASAETTSQPQLADAA